MGNNATVCQPCPHCEDCTCPNGFSEKCPQNPFESSECDTDALDDAHAFQMRTEMDTFTRDRQSKETLIGKLNDEISRLKTERAANGTQIDQLKESLKTSIKNYGAGLDQCEQTLVEAKQRAETCESSIKAPSLQSRNKTCNHLRKSLGTRAQSQRNGWSQCQCPNGTLGNDHSICARRGKRTAARATTDTG